VDTNKKFNQLAERYVASWNENDPVIRRKLIDELWAEDGTYFNRFFVASGRDMIEAVAANAHEEYFAKGFCFKSQNDAYGHHSGMKFGWVMVSSATGEVDTFGQEFLVLNEDGQILMDYMFGMKPPSS
jgi:hypothetical protein